MDDVRRSVREKYGQIAAKAGAGCCGGGKVSETIGYEAAETGAVPGGADLGLGCGNPTAIADLKPGETVLDLGSGGGIDCFLAADAVGPEGSVIGVDMTEEMIALARENAARGGYENVEFRLGEIEKMPIEDASVDVVISNCVINLVPDKQQAFAEVFRVLRPGGRVHISDIVLDGELPPSVAGSTRAYVGCVGGAISRESYLGAMESAGLGEIEITKENDASRLLAGCCEADEGGGGCSPLANALEGIVTSITVSARKPA